MQRRPMSWLSLAILATAPFCFAPRGAAQEKFFEGKTIRIIVGFTPGGGFDAHSRAIARHMGKYIPGNPTVVVDNMTGAGGIVHANYMSKQAKPDGLTIGNNIGGLFLQQIMGAKGIEFDGRKFEYIGAPAVDHPVCVLTKASGTSPNIRSGAGTTATSRTPGCLLNTNSTSAGEMFAPPRIITSLRRPVM